MPHPDNYVEQRMHAPSGLLARVDVLRVVPDAERDDLCGVAHVSARPMFRQTCTSSLKSPDTQAASYIRSIDQPGLSVLVAIALRIQAWEYQMKVQVGLNDAPSPIRPLSQALGSTSGRFAWPRRRQPRDW